MSWTTNRSRSSLAFAMPYTAENKAQKRGRLIPRGIPSSDRGAAFKARIILNLCVGGMVARTTDDAVLRRSLRAAALTQALQLLGSRADRSVRRRPRRDSDATIPRPKTQEATV